VAHSATTVWECNASATANNVNSGGFNPGNANMATDLTTDANTANTNSPVVSSASYNFVAGDVGHWVYVKSGTNWTPGWYQIASVASNKATLSAAVGQAIQTDSTKGYPRPKYGTNTVAGCATVGTPTGGTWSIDYSQATTAKHAAITNLASTNGTTNPSVVTSATVTFGVNTVGNIIHVTAGTNWTAGWYEIVSVSGGAATLDRAVGTSATLSSGTFYVGGAIALFDQANGNFTAVPVSGNRVFIKAGTYTTASTVNLTTNSNLLTPIAVEGYQTLRGDAPIGSNRPFLDYTANGNDTSDGWDFYNLDIRVLAAGAAAFTGRSQGKFINCKILNVSATGTAAISASSSNGLIFNCELICYRGAGFINTGQGGWALIDNYIHDCDIGISLSGTTTVHAIKGNIIESCVTAAIRYTAANTARHAIEGNTLYGAENKLGIGIDLAANLTSKLLLNNIVYGFVTGMTHATSTQTVVFEDYGDFYNNTTDATNIAKGAHSLALDPQFASVSQITGTAGKFRAGNDALIDTTKNFSTLGVVAGRDCVYIKTGTGITAGIYGVSSIATTTNPNDTLVLDVAPGTNTTADKSYQLTVGHNFAIGANLKAKGFPGAFPASLSAAYTDIGAVQRQEKVLPSGVMGIR